ncbi:MAG: hypothetical protein CM15mP40_06330 [Alphaproteobacteria bacterium]|nr:MAG: hypothetical protein CM15mP40_06330 [Alphaproteobacteria bacterium]
MTKLDNITDSRILSKNDQNSKQEKSQPSFLVDLREPNKLQKELKTSGKKKR